MGMQCNFSYSDVTQFPTEIIYNKDSDTYSLRIYAVANDLFSALMVNLSVPEDRTAENYSCWFDCGSRTEWQMNAIQWLIRNRIPFTCA